MNPDAVDAWVAESSNIQLSPTTRRRKRSKSGSPASRPPKRPRPILGSLDNNSCNMPRTRNASPAKNHPRIRTPSPTNIDASQTPRPPKLSYVAALTRSDSDDGVLAPDSEKASSSTRSKRSTSPVKRVAVLRDFGGGIFFQGASNDGEELGQDGQALFWDLRDLASGLQTLPEKLWNECEDSRPALGGRQPHSSHFDDNDDRDLADLRRELSDIRELNRESIRCEKELEPEAEWNSAVHGLLLRMVFGGKGSKRVGFRCMTSDKIDPRWFPTNPPGFSGSRMIDYGIYLEGDGTAAELRRSLPERIDRHVKATGLPINQFNRIGVRQKPLAISIEIKTISRTEEEARIQLGFSVAAQIIRLKQIVGDSPTGQAVLARMVFPLLLAQSATWTAMFARLDPDNYDRILIRTGLRLGESSTPRGAYCLKRCLERLDTFVATTFCGWWHELLDEGENACD